MKQTMKRLVSMLFAAVMMVASVLPVSAATIDSDKSVSLTIHKYRLEDKSDWDELKIGSGTMTDADDVPEDAEPLKGVEYTLTLMEVMDEDGDLSAIDNYQVSNNPSVELKGVTDSNGEINFNDEFYQNKYESGGKLPQGVYKITETLDPGIIAEPDMHEFLVSLPMTNPEDNSSWLYDVHAYPKNVIEEEVSLVKKVWNGQNWVDDKNVEQGEEVTWRIASGIPKTIAKSESYVVTDTMPEQLTYITDSVKVYYYAQDGSKVDLGSSDYTFTYSETKHSFTVVLEENGIQKVSGTSIKDELLYIEFGTSVEIKSESDIKEIINNASLTYVNQFGDTSTIADSAYIYSGGLEIIKMDGSTDTVLKGVEFKLYKKENSTEMYYAGLDNDGEIIWTNQSDKAKTLVTNDSGKFQVLGLEDGTYYITETKTLSNYNLLSDDIEVEIERTEESDGSYSYAIASKTVKNYKGFTLPKTGGNGTFWFTVVGLIFIADAGFVFYMNRRKKAE